MKVKLSVVIIAKNEESRIGLALESVFGWAEEIIVVDDESSDNTRAVVSAYTDKIFVRRMDIEGKHRNWAYSQASNDWVLSIDADERLTPELKKEISDVLSKPTEFSAFTVPRQNHIGDYWVRWGGQYPSAQIKLFKKDNFKWEEVEVHPRANLDGQCGHLKGDLLHFTYRNWSDFIKKLDNQTTLEALKWQKLSLDNPKKVRYKMNFFHTLWRVLDRFIRAFIGKRGYKDGFVGFMFAYFSSLYQIVSYAKYVELKKNEK